MSTRSLPPCCSLGLVCALILVSGCKHEPPPGATAEPTETTSGRGGASGSGHRNAAADQDGGLASSPAKTVALAGSLYLQAPVYATTERETRIGYIRRGSKVAVDPLPIHAANCEAGWFHLVSGGFICGKFVSLDLNRPEIRLGTAAPNFDDVLPYEYASNVAMGTPLYKSVPSREAMLEYEPYLKARETAPIGANGGSAAATAEGDDNPYAPLDPSDPDPASSADKKPWWQQSFDAKDKPAIKLSDLTEGADRVVAKRLVKGFYIAIDREFTWNDRKWYRTTSGFVAPADRFSLVKPSTFQGVDLRGTDPEQGVGFILSTKASRYGLVDAGGGRKVAVPKGKIDRFTEVRLTNQAVTASGREYRETTDGFWIRSTQATWTEPGPPPDDLAPGEKWIDVNLTRQTLVAFEGTVPVFATLISSGKKPPTPDDKAHDYQTVQGSFRIREKHISTTMDGDGPAPGDMPYSIEDVPYVMYFKDSYALHGAFWHSDFGHQHSHGCVNLAPLDAKRLFLWTEPAVPPGWHAVFVPKGTASGTRVVVHE